MGGECVVGDGDAVSAESVDDCHDFQRVHAEHDQIGIVGYFSSEDVESCGNQRAEGLSGKRVAGNCHC